MGKVLKADASGGMAYAEFDNGSAITDFWIEIEAGFFQAALDFWDSDGDAVDIILPITAALGTARPFGVNSTGGGGCEWEPEDVSVIVTAAVYHTVKYHRNGTSIDIFVDGDPIRSQVTGAAAVRYFRFGLTGAFNIDDQSYFDSVKIGTTEGGSEIFADDFEGGDLSAWTSTSGDVSVVDDPFPAPIAPPTQVFGGNRFYEAPTWRQIVTDLDSRTLTFLDRLGLDRSITVTRAASRVQTVRVPSDNPEVNIPAPDPDSPPFVSEGTRFLYSFRREAPGGSAAPWVVRAAGIVLDVADEADSDHATSIVTAYDPWKYLYRRPVLLADGSLPGDAGRVYPAGTTADEIIIEQLSIAEAIGGTVFTDYASTGFYAGTIETTDPLPDGGDGLAITFARGVTLGEMLDTLVATGTCDVVFDPIYDPANRPGILCDLSIYRKAGEFRPNAMFGWDKWPRNVVQLSRQIDGTGRANRIQMFAGQGGPPVPEQSDAASIAEFGEYWALQYLPGVPSIGAAKTIAQRQLALIANGAYTYALSPAAERAPLLFQEYREADTLPLHASRRFRDPIVGVPLRVESIPIVIGDDQLERVNQMLVSFSPETGS